MTRPAATLPAFALEPWRVYCPWTVARTVEQRAEVQVEHARAEWCRAIVVLVQARPEAMKP